MITRTAAIDALMNDLSISSSSGQVYTVPTPLNGDSDTSSAYVFDFQYGGTSQPVGMTRPSWQYNGWTNFTAAEKVRFEEMLTYVETISNIDFQLVSGVADPTMHVGKVSLPGNTAGVGGYGYGVSISGNGTVTLTNYDNFVVYDNAISLASGQDSLILHEIMHALSGKHPFSGSPNLPAAFDSNKYTVLSYIPNPDNGQDSDGLQMFDVLAIQDRWGANLNTATGNDTYTGKRNTTIDTIWDAGGVDTFDASAKTSDVILSLVEATFSTFDSVDDVAIAYDVVIENAIGGSGNDMITGNGVANNLQGGAGNDVLNGGDGNDVLNAGEDEDLLFGGSGNDLMFGGSGFDKIYGGSGVDRIFGGDDNDIANGGSDNDIINTGSGNDIVFGQNGNDLVFLQGGNDKAFAGDGNDKVFGGLGNDTINLGAGNDAVFGGAGGDVITGAGGNDTLSGGGGGDTFIFAANQGNDRITDLTDSDIIDIAAFGVTDGGTSNLDWRDATTSVVITGGGSDVTIAWQGGGTLVLETVGIASLTDSDFAF